MRDDVLDLIRGGAEPASVSVSIKKHGNVCWAYKNKKA
jgi:hypothetical protein